MTTCPDITPLLYHNPLTIKSYYTIQDNGTLIYGANTENSHEKSYKSCHAAFGCPNEQQLKHLLRGCSSTTFLSNDVIVSTGGVPLNGGFALRVSLTRGAKVIGEALHVQLRSTAELKQHGRCLPVLVEAFILSESEEVQVNVIDEFATVIALRLNLVNGGLSSNQVHKVSLPTLECHNGARLSASGCTWLSSQQVLFAMSPKLLCCDVFTGQCVEWEPNDGSSSWSLRRMSTMLTPGKSHTPRSSSSAAAVCKTHFSGSDMLIFTLHSDGSVVRWFYSGNGLSHSGSRILDESGWSVDDWSPTSDAVHICCRTYLENCGFVLGVGIKSKLVDPGHRGSVFLSALIYGPINTSNDETFDSFLELNQPSGRPDLDSIVDMSFLDASRISLQILCSTVNGSSLLVSFEPSQIGIISKDPTVSDLGQVNERKIFGFHDDVVVSRFLSDNEGTDTTVIESAMIRRIFRPLDSFPPSRSGVIRALSRVLPTQFSHIFLEAETMSIEAIVLSALRSWYSFQKESANKRKVKQLSGIYSNNQDIYDAFTQTAEKSSSGTDNKLFEYYTKWYELQLAISEEEAWIYWPLSMACVSSDAYISQATFLYRVSSTTILANSTLDQSSMKLLNILTESNSEISSIILRIESRTEMLGSTSAVLFDDEINQIYDDLNSLSESINSVFHRQEIQNAIQYHRNLLSSSALDDLHDFFMSPLISCETENDMDMISNSSTLIQHENLLLASVSGIQKKLYRAIQRGLSRCVLLSLSDLSSKYYTDVIKSLVQLKAIQWVISNLSLSELSKIFKTNISIEGTDLPTFIVANVHLFISKSISGDIAESLPSHVALRVLAPLISFIPSPQDNESFDSRLRYIKERVATYLIEESKSSPFYETSERKKRAFELYFESDRSINILSTLKKHHVNLLLSYLIEKGEDIEEESSVNTFELSEAFREFLPYQTASFCSELANLLTIRRLLNPFLSDGFYAGCLHELSTELRERKLPDIKVLLCLFSSLLHGMNSFSIFSGMGEIGLSCTKTVEIFLKTYFSLEMINQMPETATLYSAALEFAISSYDWDAGFEACKQQPLKKRQMSGFTRLVEAMVTKGYISDLLSLQLVDNGKIDWLQLAVTALQEKCRCSSKDDLINWSGSLFSLLASHGYWRNAALSMYAHYVKEKNSKQGMLSCFAAENSMYNVTQKSRRFLNMHETLQHARNELAESHSLVSTETMLINCLSSSASSILLDSHDVQNISVSDIAITLARCGYVLEALVFSKCANRSNTIHYSMDVQNILCDIIVPLSSGSVKSSYCSPTTQQLQFMRMRPGRFTGLKSFGMCLLEMFTFAFSNKSNTIGISVAKSLLSSSNHSYLPEWLTTLLTGKNAGVDGLFASHFSKNTKADPSSLLRLFMSYGFYTEACDLVTSILADPRRKDIVTTMIPEKGGIDFVPYHDIDQLWIISEKSLSICNDPASLSTARIKMLAALEQHFRWAKATDEAIVSARAVAHIT